MPAHISYPSIDQFRNLIRTIEQKYTYKQDATGEWVKDPLAVMPTLTFNASVKLHGTNASVVVSPENEQYAQSRRNLITVEKDNAGFATWHSQERIKDIFGFARALIEDKYPAIIGKTIVFYGEWAGKGIAKGVSVNDLPKFFYLFGIKVVEPEEGVSNWWMKDYPEMRAHNAGIYDARDYYDRTFDINFNNPSKVHNDIVKAVQAVEDECPVGLAIKKELGIEAEHHIGEGLVLSYITEEGELYQFKAKGQKHSTSKTKTISPIDVELLADIESFVEYAVTPNRCQQMFEENCELDFNIREMGVFIKAVSSDIVKEESDVLAANGLTMRDVGGKLSKTARNWFLKEMNDGMGL